MDKLLQKQRFKALIFLVQESFRSHRGVLLIQINQIFRFDDNRGKEQIIDDLNNTDKYQLFMLSTRAGGLGINLVGTDKVIIDDID